jgi:galactose-1-phosphate uridylyltransferase
MYVLIRRNTLEARLIGKTHPIHAQIAVLDYVPPLVSKYFAE